jgi:hypothetical protein
MKNLSISKFLASAKTGGNRTVMALLFVVRHSSDG